jgi:peroxiredoxin
VPLRAVTPAPAFELNDLDGRPVSLASLRGRTIVLCFTSVRCPASNRYAARVAALARKYADHSRVQVLAVHATAAGKDVSPTEVRVQARVSGLACPTLMDTGAAVARSLGVRNTPTVVVIDPSGGVRYHGALDDHLDAASVTRAWAADAVESLLNDRPVATPVTPEVGCVIE